MNNKDIKKMSLEELRKAHDEIKDSIDFERKIDICSQIIKLDPSDPLAFNSRGYAYTGLREYNKAIEDYNKAIELKPKYFEAFYNRGNTYAKLREYNKAIEDYNKAIEINPEDDDAFNNRGNTYTKLREYNKAIEDYNKAIEINSEDADAFYNRGNTYAKLGKYDKAIKDYNQAIKLDPKDAKAFVNLGHVYRKLGNKEEAIKNFKKANKIDPSIIVQEGTKDLKEGFEDTQDFQTILKDLKKEHKKDEKIWTRVSALAIIVMMFFLIYGKNIINCLSDIAHVCGNTSMSPNMSFYTFYMFFSIITFTIIRQYTNAKALRIEASNRVAMAKMFERVKSKEYNYRKEFLPKLADAIVYSTIKEKNSSGLVEKIINILDKLKNDKIN